jgi:hypothetical protein
MKKEKKVIIFNPCKYCLKRPVCKKQCNDLITHEESQEYIFMIALLIIITGLGIYGTIYIYLNFPTRIFLCIISLILGVLYGYAIKDLIVGGEYKEFNLFIKFLIFLLGPTTMVTAWLFYNFDLDTKINNYSNRYFNKGD